LADVDAGAAISSQLMGHPQPSIPDRHIPDSDAVSAPSDADDSPQTSPNPKRRKLSPAPDAAPSTTNVVVSASQLVHTVTSKNRDKQRRRQKKKDQARLAALSATRVADGDDETDEGADPSDPEDADENEGEEMPSVPDEDSTPTGAEDDENRERTEELHREPALTALPDADNPAEVRCRDALLKNDLPSLSWIMRARVRDSSANKKYLSASGRISYRVADQMIQKAKAIGSLPALENWKTISSHWRTNGTLTSINLYSQDPTPSQAVALPPHIDQQGPEVQAFYRAFQAANQSEVNTLLQAIFHRRILADLYTQYRSAGAVIIAPTTTSRARGVTDTAELKLALFRAIYLEHAAIHSPGKDPRSKKEWSRFGKQLEKGQRWNEVESRLGPGILAFIPETIVSHTWVEKGLPWDVFCIWLELVKEHNQAAVLQGEQMLARLGDALAGRTIPRNRLRLEKVRLAELKDVDDKSILLEEIDAEVDFSTDEE
jgi:hypothetical protein